ncbi:ABC transporter ATP-binding protein [Zhenhengia yiwuensis]|uniref:ABC transporter ATP-binding protein n=1 Tax=Zhenhengia yiwuensis TaxID=2763666 RepID=A0A926EMD1_9FIRM|nr:ABC transporter ATP-binding protein [Zhenhengia yiwuensis]MBC8580742.1 ABC transporter ATP-binding protein [Zhenhengia yiwuensis]
MEQKSSKSWRYFFKELIYANKGSSFGSSFLILVLSIVTIIKTKVIEKLIDATSAFLWDDMMKQLIVLIAIVVVNIVINYWKIKLSTYFGASSSNYMKNSICYKVLHSRYEDISAENRGDILKTINNDVETVSNFLSNDMTTLLSQFVLFFVVLGYLFFENPIIGLVTFSYTPIGMYITYQINKRMGAYYPKIAQAEGNATGALEQVISQIAVVKSFKMNERRLNKVKERYMDVQGFGFAISKYNGMMQTACSMVYAVPHIVFYIFAGWLVLHNHLTLGAMVSIDQLLDYVLGPTVFFPFILDGLNYTKAAISRIQDFSKRLTLEEDSQIELMEGSEVAVELKEVSFVFGDKKIFKNFSLNVDKNSITVISGRSGKGKTTLFDLISGIYQPNKGEINVKGKVFNMTQDTYIFTGSVMDNVRIVKPDASDEEVLDALEKACASEFCKCLAEGYNTQIGDGNGELSGGQKQRIGLARVFLSDAQILLLDEPTSSLDEETEQKIIEQFNLMSKHKIIFISTHRDSLFKLADRRVEL